MSNAKVILLSNTENPIETIASCWYASRDNERVVLPSEAAQIRRNYYQCTEKEKKGYDGVVDIFQKVVQSKIPVAEMVDFVFLLENVSIAFREQMVRHRVGIKVGERIGCDIVPDLTDSTWWSQSMRILDMGKFYDAGGFETPETINDVRKRDVYNRSILHSQKAYQDLIEVGVPMEDARMVVPLCATHRIVWKLNLASLMHIVGKRGCWILQLGFWGPILKGMIEELATKIHPIFRELIAPPCIQNNEFKSCLFKLDNERRISGEDSIPPCPLYLNYHPQSAVASRSTTKQNENAWTPEYEYTNEYSENKLTHWSAANMQNADRMERMCQEYRQLWGRDVDTGEKL